MYTLLSNTKIITCRKKRNEDFMLYNLINHMACKAINKTLQDTNQGSKIVTELYTSKLHIKNLAE